MLQVHEKTQEEKDEIKRLIDRQVRQRVRGALEGMRACLAVWRHVGMLLVRLCCG